MHWTLKTARTPSLPISLLGTANVDKLPPIHPFLFAYSHLCVLRPLHLPLRAHRRWDWPVRLLRGPRGRGDNPLRGRFARHGRSLARSLQPEPVSERRFVRRATRSGHTDLPMSARFRRKALWDERQRLLEQSLLERGHLRGRGWHFHVQLSTRLHWNNMWSTYNLPLVLLCHKNG